MTRRDFIKTLIISLALLTALPGIAQAELGLSAAKSQGLVGEQPDGLIGAVTANAETTALVAKINAARLQKYQAIADQNGTAVSDVQAVAGKKLISQTPAGQYIKNAAGKWQKK